jgi:hypothetical protein
MSEPLIRLLAELPSAEPDSIRAERTRLRCRARLARQAPRLSMARATAWRGTARQLWHPLIAVLGVVYLAEVFVQAFRVYGLFPD